MALAAIMAIFVFVFADMVTSQLQKATREGQGSPSATVVTWDGGSITGQKLETLRQRRYFISNFLRELYMQGARAVASEGGTPLDPTVPNFVLPPESSEPRRVMVGTVTTRILAQLASDAGMTVSDEIINHYLREFGLRKVSDSEIAQILKKTGRGNVGYAEKQLFSGLRELLLQNYYMRSYSASTQNIMPEQRWDDWQQINRRIALEAAVVPTEKFLAEATEPTDTEVQELYDEFKDQIGYQPQMDTGVPLTSPDPGFREPRRVRLQFLLGDVNQWTEKLLETVTDEEIADYYERNKRTQFVKVDLFSTESAPAEEAPAESKTEAPAEEDKPAEEPAEESENKTEVEPKESPAEKPAEEPESTEPEAKEPAATEPETTESESTEPETTEPESTEPASEETEPASEESDSNPEAEESSSSPQVASPFRFVSLQEESAEEEEAPAAEQPSEAQPAEPQPVAEATGESVTAEESVPQETPETDAGAPSEEPSEDSELASEELASEAKEEPTEKEEPVEYESLETVRDEIRRRLANDKAVVELDQVMGRVFAELQSKYNRYGGDLILAKNKGSEVPSPPAELTNLDGMATKHGLVREETALLSYLELQETSLGKATDAQAGRTPVWYAAFAKSQMELYEPFLAQDLDGQWYLAVKVEDVESNVPPLEAVRDQVVSAWKTRAAAKLALNRAEELAKEAEESGETLAGFFADKSFEVVSTDLFSRLTFGTTAVEMRSGARLGEAPPLESIDRNFMDKAFELKTDQVVAILNHDQTNAYIIRLDRREKTVEELHQLFLLEANDWFGGRIMRRSRLQFAQRNLEGQLLQRVGVDLSGLEKYLAPDDDR